ncbi:hypothetical protein NGB36_13410 [Streptomyces sp. RB6PN25]|uniref:Integral membrane protein n=1 Tax=Streptomyces humicola TaxID=2953240 RepID=A0ABT1PYH5_9ACTN|nr:mannosyltransferase family protein [Streptomyces humicola]MCQ4081575.1 hypothetical protein [Streptomyces humicola]
MITSSDSRPQDAPANAAAREPGTLLRRAAVTAQPALAVWAGAALLQFLMVWWLHSRPSGWLYSVLTPWDNQWYVQIAEQGYPHTFAYDGSGLLAGNNLAFFPLYPLLIRAVHAVTGLDAATASIAVAWLASAAAAVVVHRLGVQLFGPRTALVLLVLVFTQPMAITLWIGYSESLFLALAAGCLLAARREAWLTAGGCALLAGLTRSTGTAVALALALAAVLAMWQQRRIGGRAVAGVVVGALGVPVYLLWVGLRVGSIGAWLTIQREGWHTAWDWGDATWHFLTSTLQRGSDWVPVATAVLLLGLAAACATAVLQRPWPPLAAYGLLVFALTVGQTNYYHSKLRLLVPALLTLVPLARSFGRAQPRAAVPALTAFSLFGTWFGAYMLTDWVYAI